MGARDEVGVYLADLSDFAEMNEVYEQYVTKPYPARTTVGCQLPNIMLEVDCIAVVAGIETTSPVRQAANWKRSE